MPDPDDLLPDQRGVTPPDAVIAEREVLRRAQVGRMTRLRSWAAIAGALVVLLVLFYFARQV